MTDTERIDRPAAIRKALRDIVAEHGFHGASMGAVARAAGVATGTAYVHYESKEELVYATYVEVKHGLGRAAVAGIDHITDPRDRYERLFRNVFEHVRSDPAQARFLLQLEASPYQTQASVLLEEVGDPLSEEAARPDFAELLVDLPDDVLYAMSIGLAVRLVVTGLDLSNWQLATIVDSSWRAITRRVE